jgi:hypothetical protein
MSIFDLHAHVLADDEIDTPCSPLSTAGALIERRCTHLRVAMGAADFGLTSGG